MSQQVNSSIKPSNDKFVLANKCENTGMSFPMHHHSEYEFYYVLEGEGRLFLDNTILYCCPWTALLIFPSQWTFCSHSSKHSISENHPQFFQILSSQNSVIDKSCSF